jgi:hypothetical protein
MRIEQVVSDRIPSNASSSACSIKPRLYSLGTESRMSPDGQAQSYPASNGGGGGPDAERVLLLQTCSGQQRTS